jgi:hypothetical protein
MEQATNQANTAYFVRQAIQQYRTKLLDLTNRNPLINFRHSERSRSHIRIVDAVPERLFTRLINGDQLSFEALPDPELIPNDEKTPVFSNLLRQARSEDQIYRNAIAELGPNPSHRQRQKVERLLRNRIREKLGLDNFQPSWEPTKRAQELYLNPDYELPKDNGQIAQGHRNSKIRTLFFSEDLDRKLGRLRSDTRVLEKDAGFNALYCAFGFLEYCESDAGKERRLAPLVFIPLLLDRVLVEHRYSYFIKSRNEDVEINFALGELLKGMSINLPPWEENEEDENPLGAYFNCIERTIADKRDWKLRRHITIGLFTFSTLAMYRDLDPQRWPAGFALEQQPVIRNLIAGAETGDLQYAEEYEIDTLQEPEPLLITDADSSQLSAVIDVLRGKSSYVIQGPPGTGKSQTITNIIAAALDEELSVLFVAEKMAALDVVKKRLDAAGLGAFCLELHSNKTSKTKVAETLGQRLAYQPVYVEEHLLESKGKALLEAKEELLYYVNRLNDDAGDTGLKLYDVFLGSAIREKLKSKLPESLVEARFDDPLGIMPHNLIKMLDAAITLEIQMQPLAKFGKLHENPWRGIQNVEITESDEARLLGLISKWNDSIKVLLENISTVSNQTGLKLPDAIAELESVCESVLKIHLPPENLLPDTYKTLVSETNHDLLKTILNVFENFLEYETTLDKFTARISHLRSIGSEMCRDAITELQEIGLDKFTISSLAILNTENQQLALRISELESFCNTIRHALNLQNKHVQTMRAAVTGIELLGELNRQLWVKRSPLILAEENHSLLETAAEEAATLWQHRTRLAFEFDLRLLPPVNELRNHIVALEARNAFTSLFNRDSRKAKRVYRSIARYNRKKSLSEMAEALLRCVQYLEDIEKLSLNSELKNICGNHFNGPDTPFEDLARVANWAKEVRQRLAGFGETGRRIRDFLFNRTPDQLDKCFSLREQSSFDLLKTTLDEIIENENTEWHELAQQQHTRANKLSDSLKTFKLAGFHDTCSKENILTAVDALDSAEKARSSIEADANCLQLVGGTFNTLRENYEALTATLEFADNVSSLDVSQLYIQYLFADPSNVSEFQSAAQDLLSACSNVVTCQKQTGSFAQLDPDLWCGTGSFTVIQLTKLLERNQFAIEHMSDLRDYLNFLSVENAAYEQGIGPVLAVYSSNNLDYLHLRPAVEFVFYRSAAEAILQSDDRLKKHFGAAHQELRNRFPNLDRGYLELRRKRLATHLYHRPCPAGNAVGPAENLTELALVRRIANQTRSRISVRDLISRAGKAIQGLKPCWMMSPASVARFIEPGKLFFDLIIMDEASQIRLAEAIGGIARGKKAVIVGDQMQLPPTAFFQKLPAGKDTEDDENKEEREDSVLEAAASRFHPLRRLKWHYRSEHDSLIKFSNTEFYNDQLIVFPSPYYDHPAYGVSLEQIDGIYESGINESEGKAVVHAAIDFMKECPEQSLGIVAVNSKQTEFIREALDLEIALNTQAAAFVQNWEPTLEPLFVKNLENVQGDERDVIFISTVYGKDKNGNFYQRYGPINSVYGHRRLNVLFTRAKKRIKVFTSMSPRDIHDEGRHWGVKVLKEYLQFARDGFSVNTDGVGGECESEFEHWVLQVLRSYGYEGIPHVGVCDYRIDIAVRHPGKPGVFLCGIECDGAAYRSACPVRERDRLRYEILEKYGWRIYRIWSTDWYRNPSFQTRQLIGYLQELHPTMNQ